jgi:hypothetical protein
MPLVLPEPGHEDRTRTPDAGGASDSGIEDEDEREIDPNEFDLLVSRSATFSSAPILEPESLENAMLRGPRRYSTTSSAAKRPHSTSRRRPSTLSDAADALSATDDGEATEQTPLLAPKISPFLGNVSTTRFWLIFAPLMAAFLIACFDSTIMASSHPVITSYFKSSNSASWLTTAFLLTSTACQPLVGRLSDTVGRKRPYLAMMFILAAATAWCALAGSMTSFILARAMCGVGAGGMLTLGSIITSDLVPIK